MIIPSNLSDISGIIASGAAALSASNSFNNKSQITNNE